MMQYNVKTIQRPCNTQEAAPAKDSTVIRMSSAHLEGDSQSTRYTPYCLGEKSIIPSTITINTIPHQTIMVGEKCMFMNKKKKKKSRAPSIESRSNCTVVTTEVGKSNNIILVEISSNTPSWM